MPGPDKYDPAPLKVGYMKRILGGAMNPIEKDEKFPGPGTYNPGGSYDPESGNTIKGVPSFKIVKPGQTKVNERTKGSVPVREEVNGPWTYAPEYPTHVSKGVRMGTSVRVADTTHAGKPAPNKYVIAGDFDFKDPNNREESLGKDPKFHFGMNSKTRDRNLDMPGPGEYDMNVYPSNQANIQHVLGSDYRKDMSVPNAHLYPGPGSYEPFMDIAEGAAISFTRERKKTKIEKTYAPGPASYNALNTVGVANEYNRYERHDYKTHNAPLRKQTS